MKITLEELLAFTAVVDSGSVTAAADRLGQTTSGVSRALSRLEAKLDATLLRRTTRRLSLTEEGQSFTAPAREILRSVDQAEELMALRRRLPAGRLRVNAAAPFMAHVLVPMVAEFRRRYPQIELELDTDDRNIDLLEKRADIAIRIGALRDSTLHARLLGNSRLRILASPDYLQRHGEPRGVEDLHRHCLLGFTYPELLNQWPLRHRQARHFAIEPTISASSGRRCVSWRCAGGHCPAGGLYDATRSGSGQAGTAAGAGDAGRASTDPRGVLPRRPAGGAPHLFSRLRQRPP